MDLTSRVWTVRTGPQALGHPALCLQREEGPDPTTSCRNQGRRRSDTSFKYPQIAVVSTPFPRGKPQSSLLLETSSTPVLSPSERPPCIVTPHPCPSHHPLCSSLSGAPRETELPYLMSRTVPVDRGETGNRTGVCLGLQQASGQAGTQTESSRLQVKCYPHAVHCSLPKMVGWLRCSTDE